MNGLSVHKSLQAVFNRQASLHLDICQHLSRLLNARQGSLAALPDYGLPDFLSVFRQLPEGLNDFLKMIKHCIERYEPRLKNIRVSLCSELTMQEVLPLVIVAEDAYRQVMTFKATVSQCDGVAVYR
jgi:type VI secretion system protein